MAWSRRESLDRFNTNRVAEVAGRSVGWLYQYFPNKASSKRCGSSSDAIAMNCPLGMPPHTAQHFLTMAKALVDSDAQAHGSASHELDRRIVRAIHGYLGDRSPGD